MKATNRLRTSRRKFAFWLGFGLFGLSERLNAGMLDDFAAAAMHWSRVDAADLVTTQDDTADEQQVVDDSGADQERPVHWSAGENRLWRWFERETFIEGEWQLSGITLPINKRTGEPFEEKQGYLSESLVPDEIRNRASEASLSSHSEYAADGPDEGEPNAERRARHGRPPSKWLRSLNAEELKIWLKRIHVPEAGVSGMTFWTHLTRDHSFDAELIEGLNENEQAKLHAAAHYGY